MISAIVAVATGALAQGAGATVLIQNHTDPAGDPASVAYHLDLPSGLPAADFVLGDGEEKGFGPFEGTVIATAAPAAGWHVADIRCTGPDLSAFDIDVAHGRVTMQHMIADEQICAFTQRRNDASPTSTPAPSAPGLAPQPPASARRSIVPQRRAAVLGIFARRRSATARVSIVRRSVIKTQLLWRGRVIGISRVVRPAGTYDVTIRVPSRLVRRLRHEGRRRVTLTVRVVVVPRPGPGAASVFRYGVIVPL